jgi:hypothetical protein
MSFNLDELLSYNKLLIIPGNKLLIIRCGVPRILYKLCNIL